MSYQVLVGDNFISAVRDGVLARIECKGSASLRSSAVKSRHCTSGICSVRKKSGETICQAKTGRWVAGMMEFVIGHRARRTTNVVSIHPDNKADQAPGTRECPLDSVPFVSERGADKLGLVIMVSYRSLITGQVVC